MTPGAFLSTVALLLLVIVLPIWPWTRGLSYRPTIVMAVAFQLAVLVWVFDV